MNFRCYDFLPVLMDIDMMIYQFRLLIEMAKLEEKINQIKLKDLGKRKKNGKKRGGIMRLD